MSSEYYIASETDGGSDIDIYGGLVSGGYESFLGSLYVIQGADESDSNDMDDDMDDNDSNADNNSTVSS